MRKFVAGSLGLLLSISSAPAWSSNAANHSTPASEASSEANPPTGPEWNFAAMSSFVSRSESFAQKPCVVYREHWDPEWKVKIAGWDAAIAAGQSADVSPMKAAEVTGLTIHQTAGFMGQNAVDVRDLHVQGNGWSDIGYHYVLTQRPKLLSFSAGAGLLRLKNALEKNGWSEFKILQFLKELKADLKARTEFFDGAKAQALRDPRNKGCVAGADGWLLFEGRPPRFQGAHAGNTSLRFDKATGLYTAVAPAEDAPGGWEPMLVNASYDDDIEEKLSADERARRLAAGEVHTLHYKLDAVSKRLVLSDATGKAITDPRTSEASYVDLRGQEAKFLKPDGSPKDAVDGSVLTLSNNKGRIGIVIVGTYQARGPEAPFGFHASASEALRQPSKATVTVLGQAIHALKRDYPAIEEIKAHRSGQICQVHNITGGDCPGEGCLPMMRALADRFTPATQEASQ